MTPLPQPESSRYRFEKLLGEGAMGEVLLASDPELERPVAYKRLLSQLQAQPGVLRRFLLEARITAQLDHPNIVPIYQLERLADGQIGYTMKPVAGKTLKQLLTEAREQVRAEGRTDEAHSLPALLGILLKVCDALDYAHVKGVIHRDLKPANLMIGAYGEVYVMDWGIARVMGQPEEVVPEPVSGPGPESGEAPQAGAQDAETMNAEADLEGRTRMGQILGTLRYMSPQQAAGKNDELDGRSDLFALGLILFEIVTLQQAIVGTDQMALLRQVLKAELAPCLQLTGKPVARELKAIIARATARKPEQRYARVSALAADVRRYLRNEAVTAQPDTPWQAALRWLAHHPRMALLLVGGALLLSAAGIGLSLYRAQQTQLDLRWREQRLSQLLTRHGEHSHRLERIFLRAEGVLRALSAVSTETLLHGPDEPGSGGIDLQGPAAAPGRRRLGTGLLPDLRRLHQLGASLDREPLPPAQAQTLLPRSPLLRLELALDDGLRLGYPSLAPESSQADWLAALAPRRLPQWQPLAWRGDDALLSCLSGLYDYNERRLGAARIELSLQRLVNQHFAPALTGLEGYLVLDASGRTLIEDGRIEADPKPFSVQSVHAAAKARRPGYSEDRDSLYLYRPLARTGWLHVARFRRRVLERP